MDIPPGISEVLLPQDDLNVVDLISFAISIGKKAAPDLLAMPDTELFSKTGSRIMGEEHVVFLHALAVPTVMEVKMLQERLENIFENEANEEEQLKSIVYPLPSATSETVRLPFWVLEYWSQAHTIIEEKSCWSPAISWLKQQKSPRVIDLLRDVPWNYHSPDPELKNALDMRHLALFCSEEWLRTPQMDTMQDKYASAEILDAENSSPIDLKSAYLKTFLADEKDVSVEDILPEVKNEEKAQSAVMNSEREDNDFSMDFD